jgi:hypothetical protein
MSGKIEQPKVFISYARSDKNAANKIYTSLNKAGLDAWIDYRNIQAGQHWDRSIQTALEQHTHLTMIHSLASFVSNNVWDEWSYFLNRNKVVIPLIFEDIALPFRLERLQYVDFVNQPFDVAIKQLIRAILGWQPGGPSGAVSKHGHMIIHKDNMSKRPEPGEREPNDQYLYADDAISDDVPTESRDYQEHLRTKQPPPAVNTEHNHSDFRLQRDDLKHGYIVHVWVEDGTALLGAYSPLDNDFLLDDFTLNKRFQKGTDFLEEAERFVAGYLAGYGADFEPNECSPIFDLSKQRIEFD